MKTEEACCTIPFWSRLNDTEKQYVRDNLITRTFRKNEMLYGDCDSYLGMIHIISGSIRVYIVSDEGREITLFRMGEGECCVLSASCVITQITFETNIVADCDSEVVILNTGAFQHIMDSNIYVKCDVYQFLTQRFSHVMWVMQSILFQHFDARLAGYFLDCFDKTGKKEIKMTQENIARDVNSAREVVARMLKQFAQDGLVELKRGGIFLKDIDGLRKIV